MSCSQPCVTLGKSQSRPPPPACLLFGKIGGLNSNHLGNCVILASLLPPEPPYPCLESGVMALLGWWTIK